MSETEGQLRRLPSVDRVLRSEVLRTPLARYARGPVTDLIREILDDYRAGPLPDQAPDPDAVALAAADRIAKTWTPWPHVVINATGVILHTNLGRAPLSQAAIEAMVAVSRYSTLEYDLTAGTRGSRHAAAGDLLHALTGAEAAHLTVNNASAVMLALAALAKGKEVLVSRGQAVEIGGGFRIPVILRQSGAKLIEVGTTNRTRLADYEDAITPRTAAILHVHTSNFRLVGFTEGVPLPELADLARRRQVVLIDDNGSGSLLDTAKYGLSHEPTPIEALRAGADVVAFSGDKLLGGPQAGILLGRQESIGRIAGYPLARAVRPDKMTLAALDATLLAYLTERAESEIPVWFMISQPPERVAARARRFAAELARYNVSVSLRDGESTVGGGSLPGETLPTTLIALPRPITAASLRRASVPIIARTQDRHVLLDLRTVAEGEETALLDAVCSVIGRGAPPGSVVDSATVQPAPATIEPAG